MSALITNEMVDLAAREARAWGVVSKNGEWTNEETQQQCARDILEAVAPLIAAKALRDAADEVCTHSYKSDEVTGVPTSEQVSWLVGTSDAHRMFDRLLKDRAERFERGES